MTNEIAIETKDLTKRFDKHLAVNHVNLEIKSGEVYGLIGPNGAGKTTLIKMLACMEEPSIGEVYLYGDRLLLNEPNLRLKRYLGYLPDDFPLYGDLKVWDYLEYFARLYHLRDPKRTQRLFEVLEMVQLTGKKDSYINTLSRGMKQRLSLARTIIHEPLLLLLDEPVSGLDPIARQQFRDIIKILASAGITVLISSHVLSDLAELCSSVGIMELGSLVESSSLELLYQKHANRQIKITILGDMEVLEDCLEQFSSVVEGWKISTDRKTVVVNFTGNEANSAELMRSLITAGVEISNFHLTQEDLENVFLKLGHGQAS